VCIGICQIRTWWALGWSRSDHRCEQRRRRPERVHQSTWRRSDKTFITGHPTVTGFSVSISLPQMLECSWRRQEVARAHPPGSSNCTVASPPSGGPFIPAAMDFLHGNWGYRRDPPGVASSRCYCVTDWLTHLIVLSQSEQQEIYAKTLAAVRVSWFMAVGFASWLIDCCYGYSL